LKPVEFADCGEDAMEHEPIRLTVSILRTVLYLLDGDPAFSADNENVLEFKRATKKLVAEIESQHGIESTRPSVSGSSRSKP
jgi:hypothetical protein